mgnify:CR=1 FL=1
MFLLPLCAGKLEELFKHTIYLDLGVPYIQLGKFCICREMLYLLLHTRRIGVPHQECHLRGREVEGNHIFHTLEYLVCMLHTCATRIER